MGLSAYLADKLAAQMFNGTAYTWPTTFYVGLFTTQPSGGSGGTEASYTGYARVLFDPTSANWTIAGSEAKNAVAINFPANTGTAQTIVGYGLFDASTGGNLLTDNTLTTQQTVNNGATPSFAIDALTITFTISP